VGVCVEKEFQCENAREKDVQLIKEDTGIGRGAVLLNQLAVQLRLRDVDEEVLQGRADHDAGPFFHTVGRSREEEVLGCAASLCWARRAKLEQRNYLEMGSETLDLVMDDAPQI
jgi:hypothetical protein